VYNKEKRSISKKAMFERKLIFPKRGKPTEFLENLNKEEINSTL